MFTTPPLATRHADEITGLLPRVLGSHSPWRDRLLSARDDFYAAQAALNRALCHPVKHMIYEHDGNWLQHRRYPEGTAEDPASGQSWFYHASHSPRSEATDPVDEHGHFHTFVNSSAIDPQATPIAAPRGRRKRDDCVTHLVGLSIGMNGLPLRLFALARRTSDEMMFSGEVLMPHLRSFWRRDAAPHALTGRWLSAVLRLFEPEVTWLLAQRDHEQRRLNRHWLKSRVELLQPEVLCSCPVPLEARLQLLDAAEGHVNDWALRHPA